MILDTAMEIAGTLEKTVSFETVREGINNIFLPVVKEIASS